MNVTDELLMAYADDQVDGATREQVEHAIAADPVLRLIVDRHRALRAKLNAAFDPVLAEPVPDRLSGSIAITPAANVTDLAKARVHREDRMSSPLRQPAVWMSLAASVVFGIAIGFFAFNGDRDAMLLSSNGLTAAGPLESALSTQLASDINSNDDIRIGVSYRSKSGQYCRSFAVTSGYAGFACRDADIWRIRMLTPAAAAETGEFRTASAAMPASIMQAIADDMTGEALDAEAESQARARGWKN